MQMLTNKLNSEAFSMESCEPRSNDPKRNDERPPGGPETGEASRLLVFGVSLISVAE